MEQTENLASSAAMQSIVLLPCPFCGGQSLSFLLDEWDFAKQVGCNECNCKGSALSIQPGTKEAARTGASRKWNTRSTI